jgi:phosphoribosylglycinamide formyltransferase-1
LAAAAGIPSAVITDRERASFAAAAEPLLRERQIELICLAGFMRVLDADFVEVWRNRMVNIHPSLLPSFR